MPTVYILMGAQGSGKSTWAAANAERLNAVVLASDEVRNDLETSGTGDPNDGDRVFSLVEAKLDRLLAQGLNVIVDATHARHAWRRNELDIARRHGAQVVGVWFDETLAACLARNAGRASSPVKQGSWGDKAVPEDYLEWVWRGFEAPEPEEFDEVWTVTAKQTG